MIRLWVNVRDRIARRRMRKLVRTLSPDVALELIAQRQLRWIDRNLKSAGLEKPWKTMAPSTIIVRPVRSASNNFSSQFLMQLSQSFMILRKDGSAVTVGTRQKYAEYHHYGTRPYVITPKRAKMLRFIGASGAPVFARRVNHPGLPSRKMLPSKALAERLAVDVIKAAAKRV